MDWLVRLINRLWFCRREGHIWSHEYIEIWTEEFYGIQVRCIACGHRQLYLDIERTGIAPYTLDN